MSRDFLLLVFFMNQFPPRPRVFLVYRFDFFRKFAEIFASQGAPPVSTTPVANFPQVSTTSAAKLPPVSTTPAANFSTVFAGDESERKSWSSDVKNWRRKLEQRCKELEEEIGTEM